MSIATSPASVSSTVSDTSSQVAAPSASKAWRCSVKKYDRAYDIGLFDGQRVELIDGKIIRMSPQNEPHVIAVMKTDSAVSKAFGEGYIIRRQAPIHLGPWSKPEPDVAVVSGTLEDSLTAGTPTQALLVIEISDATLTVDRNKKMALYAEHEIQDYWILNLVDRQLEVHRKPISASRRGSRFTDVIVLKPDQQVSPLMRPDLMIKVSDLLPKFPPFRNA